MFSSAEGLPPAGSATGWPWTTGSTPLPEMMPDGRPWPLISIVTPSYNQGPFLERAIRSVLLQGYPRLEFIVMDGGSSDESAAILSRYEGWLTHWRSEPDDGPADALNKGFALATGDIFGFLNADDFYLPGSLEKIARAFAAQPAADVISGHGYFGNAAGDLGPAVFSDRWNLNRFGCGVCILIQPATFFRRSAFTGVNGFRHSRGIWDFELWADMALAGATFGSIDEFLAVCRLHGASITGGRQFLQDRDRAARAVMDRVRGRPEAASDRFWKLFYRTTRFAKHPWRSVRQRWYFYSTLGRWYL